MRALDELALAERSIVLFFSDHGETFKYRDDGEHKFVCFDDAIRVPCIARWPGYIEPGLVLDAMVGLQDLMPTILDYAGCSIPPYLHGVSLRPFLGGLSPEWRQAYYVENITFVNRYEQRCIRTGTSKLILSDAGPHELYDLQNDPEEELNIYDTPRDDPYKQFIRLPSFKPKIRELATLLRDYARQIDDATGIRLAENVLRQTTT